MTRSITLILIISMFLGCKQNSKIEPENIPTNMKLPIIGKSIIQPTKIKENEVIEIGRLDTLIPIDTVNSNSKNVYEKFGLEFTGNCYECDLAELSINKKTIKLTNVCDVTRNQILEIEQITNINNGLEIKTKELNFVFNEIEKVPIYELKIIGDMPKIENLRISKFYTLKKILKKFKQHDCGDFEG